MSSIEKAVERLGVKPGQVGPGRTVGDSPNGDVQGRHAAPAIQTAAAGLSGEAGESLPQRKVALGRPSSGPTLGFDLARMNSEGILTPDSPDGHLSEELRRIKRPLLENAFGRSASLVDRGNLIVVTSALAGEGKTCISLSLAMSIVMELDRTVLLVDADVKKATATKYLTQEPALGLIDIVADPQADIGDAIVATDIPKLRMLPAGRNRANVAELLASERMHRIADELAQRYDDRVVIFDTPPLLMTSESAVIAGLVGQIVLVVEAERTAQSSVQQAISVLDRDKAIGLLFNKSKTGPGGGYAYYYGYGYGYGKD